jgi:hypothetical protein
LDLAGNSADEAFQTLFIIKLTFGASGRISISKTE